MAQTPIPVRPLDGSTAPELLPWATSGTTLEPSAGQEDLGHRPQSTGGPPDYRIENWFRSKLSGWISRLAGVVLLAERAQKTVTIGGTVGEGDEYDFSFNSLMPETYTTPLGYATHDEVAAGAAAYLNSLAPLAALYVFESAAAVMYVTKRVPGVDFTLESTIGAGPSGAPTVTDAAVTGKVLGGTKRLAVRAAGDDGVDVDLVVGSTSTDDLGTSSTRARMVWRKLKYAFRAGKVSGAQWDEANVGTGSAAFGENNTASGAHSTASGYNNLASGDGSVALGRNNTASAADTVAMGNGSEATAAGAIALGGGAQSGGLDSIAAGAGAVASGDQSLALGASAHASDDNAVAIGLAATAGGSGSTAIGPGATVDAGSTGAVALGTGQVTGANGDNALAGPGGVATFERAVALGGTASAPDAFSQGLGSLASNRGEFARSSGKFGGVDGSAQYGTIHIMASRASDVPVEITAGNVAASSWSPIDDRSYMAEVLIVARHASGDLGTAGDTASWKFSFVARKEAGTATTYARLDHTGATFAENANITPYHDDSGGNWHVRLISGFDAVDVLAIGRAVMGADEEVVQFSGTISYVGIG